MAKKDIYMPKPGYRASPLQQLSSKRNWDRLQIKGSTGQLRQQLLNSAMDGTNKSYLLGQLNNLEEALTVVIDKKWAADKVAFEMAVAEEAFSGPAKVVAVTTKEPTPISQEEATAKIKVKRSKIAEAAKEL